VLSSGYENKPSDLLIQVFSVRHDNKLIGMAYDQEDGGWEANAKEYVNTLVPSSPGFSAVAACGNVEKGLISVFYQSEANIIAKYSLGEKKRIPLGIPTSLDIDTGDAGAKSKAGDEKPSDAKSSGNNNAIPAGDNNDRAIPTSAIESGFGLAYAIQQHTWTTNTTDKLPPVTSLKTSPPIQQGYTGVIGFNEAPQWSPFIYGGPMIDTIPGKAVNHRGYLYAKVGGDYSFSMPVEIDITLLWVGATALKDYDTDNAFMVYKRPESGSWPSGTTKTMHCYKGSYTPIRIITMSYSGSFRLDLTIKAPDGTMVLSGNKPQAYDWIKQHSPKGDLVNATPFPPFGKEI
jgi:GLEYA domain-containing protein